MILTPEALLIALVLSVGFISSQPKPVVSIEAIDRESERNTGACDAAGGGWDECTMKEMQRVLMP